MASYEYLLVADVLGFGRIITNLPNSDLDDRIRAWVDLVESAASDFGIDRIQLISDTLFASAPSSTEGLATLLGFARQLLVNGIEASFPIRGAIAYGPFAWGTLTYGRAVIAAHELEQAQNWIGISCTNKLPDDHAASLWSTDGLVVYPPPFKREKIRLHPVVSWPVPTAKRLTQLLMGGGLTSKGEAITWELGEKMTNTIIFGLYLDWLRTNDAAANRFHSEFLPVHAIASLLEES